MAVASTQALITLTAGADLSASDKQYTFVKVDTSADNQVVAATAGTDDIIGILQNRPESGAAANICISGRSVLRASAGIANGDRVTATTAGEGVKTTTAGHCVAGIALTTVSNADEYVEVLVVNSRVPA